MVGGGEPVAGDVLAGKYRVERVLGRGGMGVVLAATHATLGHQVAVKLLLSATSRDEDLIARFFREAQVTARLKSVHVARTLDMGQLEDGRPFLVMELLEGCDLGALLAERGRKQPVAELVLWVLQACEGIAEAHAAGIVHRDLKPANLFVARDPGGGDLVKVLDFGISKLTADGDRHLTSTSATFGSPVYMSPEQMRSARTADARSDLWSLGVILYEGLAGQPPFDGETVFGLAQSVMNEEPVPLALRRGDVPRGVSEVVMRCLAKDPLERPANVAELADALAEFAGARGRERANRVRRALEASAPRVRPSDPALGATDELGEAPTDRVEAPPRHTAPLPNAISLAATVPGVTPSVAPPVVTSVIPPAMPSAPGPAVASAIPPPMPRPVDQATTSVLPAGESGRFLAGAVEPLPRERRGARVIGLVALAAVIVLGAGFGIGRARLFAWGSTPALGTPSVSASAPAEPAASTSTGAPSPAGADSSTTPSAAAASVAATVESSATAEGSSRAAPGRDTRKAKPKVSAATARATSATSSAVAPSPGTGPFIGERGN